MSVIAQSIMLEKIKKERDIVVLLSSQSRDEVLMEWLKFFYLNDLIKKKQFIKALTEFLLSFMNRTVVQQFNLGEARRYLPFFANKMKSHL